MSRHYVYGAGQFGCLYDYGPFWAETPEDAADSLTVTLALVATQRRKLIRERYLRLPKRTGADYCEITECDCDNPESHGEF